MLRGGRRCTLLCFYLGRKSWEEMKGSFNVTRDNACFCGELKSKPDDD